MLIIRAKGCIYLKIIVGYLLCYLIAKVLPVGLFVLNCTDLQKSLYRRTEQLVNKLMSRMSQDNAATNCKSVVWTLCVHVRAPWLFSFSVFLEVCVY